MEVFGELAKVVGVAAGLGIVARIVGQPAILGYVAAGAILGEMGGTMELLGRLGVTLLLFLVGLELPVGELKKMGRTALVSGIGQIVFTAVVGYGLARWLGLANMESWFLAVALAFSSTIVIVKLLSEKKDLQSLYGRIAVGFLLVQDFVAVGLLMVLSGWVRGGSGWEQAGWAVVKGVVLVAVTLWLAVKVMPGVVDRLAKTGETLFAGAVAWCLVVAAAAASPVVGFGAEIGGFLAGLALSGAGEHLQVAARVKPLRDFFLMLFFVWLGSQMGVGDWRAMWWPAAVFSLFVLVGNPVIVFLILGAMGYKKRTAFLAGLTVAQISEFSLVLMALAVANGAASRTTLGITTIVGAVTMTVSTYMVMHGEWLYRRLAGVLGMFKFGKGAEKTIEERRTWEGHIVLFGHGRTGSGVRPTLAKSGKAVVVVDFDPRVVDKLKAGGIESVYGDMGDVELLEELELKKAKLIVSTVPDVQDNLLLLEYLKQRSKGVQVVVAAADETDARRLDQAGANYVLQAQKVGGEYLAHVLSEEFGL